MTPQELELHKVEDARSRNAATAVTGSPLPSRLKRLTQKERNSRVNFGPVVRKQVQNLL